MIDYNNHHLHDSIDHGSHAWLDTFPSTHLRVSYHQTSRYNAERPGLLRLAEELGGGSGRSANGPRLLHLPSDAHGWINETPPKVFPGSFLTFEIIVTFYLVSLSHTVSSETAAKGVPLASAVLRFEAT